MSLRGEFWEVRYDGRSAIVADSRGMRYIALLMAQAGREPRPMHARELVALASGEGPRAIELDAQDDVLDAAAKQQLARRLEDIAAERERACAVDDFEHAAQLDDEFERIALELRRAARGGGSGRGGFGGDGERARKAVAKAIAEAVARIRTYKEVAPLADHLGTALRKGQWLSYGGGIDWQVEFTPSPPRK